MIYAIFLKSTCSVWSIFLSSFVLNSQCLFVTFTVFIQYQDIERMSIELCHPHSQDLDEDDGETEEVLDPYFADPNGARITQFTVCYRSVLEQLL